MSITCAICRDFVTERPQLLLPNADLVICALRCGHVFHRVCVQEWFHCTAEIRAHPNRTDLLEAHVDKGSCPVCKKQCLLSKSQRIFATGDEDCDSVVELKKDLTTVVDQKQQLAMELSCANWENHKLMRELADIRKENSQLHKAVLKYREDIRVITSDYIQVAKKLVDNLESQHVKRQLCKSTGHLAKST